jgi:hypothetical protein
MARSFFDRWSSLASRSARRASRVEMRGELCAASEPPP